MNLTVPQIMGMMTEGTQVLVDPVTPGAYAAVNATATVAIVLASSAKSPDFLYDRVYAEVGDRITQISDEELGLAMKHASEEFTMAVDTLLCSSGNQDRPVDLTDWVKMAQQARATNLSVEEQEQALLQHARDVREVLGDASAALTSRGPLAGDMFAEKIAGAIGDELSYGMAPVNVTYERGKTSFHFDHPESDAEFMLSVKTAGQYAGTIFRYVDGKLSDFGEGRPAGLLPDGQVIHREPDVAKLPLSWSENLQQEEPAFAM
ncbi:hypothetical protein ACFOY8_14200 [Thalassospira xianhensis]|uniref:Uncharacterized protein n=2 Tax=Thalassospira TaxID=168934 RepID=A0A285TSE0_9PROT|nr:MULTISPECIES: hypothetical protein [Thalassospira]RCK07692.1 hypothetical protein TH5_01065 [Thalassospira xianhensis MCCC 1A02616]SOC26405.1 hypothetical protein SAMN05428964_105111 [Thalassospira xiamenensis]